jgi:hypothetical protein
MFRCLVKLTALFTLLTFLFAFLFGLFLAVNTAVVINFGSLNKSDPLYSSKAKALNLSLSSVGAIAGFPEIAKTNMYLAYGGGKNRTASGAFLLESEKINDAVRKLKQKGPGSSKYVAWTHNEMWSDTPRVALATNPITIKYDSKSGHCHYFHGDVFVKYPMNHKTTVVPGLITVEEGIYGEMQRRGEYKPFSMRYEFKTCDGIFPDYYEIIWFDDVLELAYRVVGHG